MMEFLDVVDENGIPTGETVERSIAHANGDQTQDLSCMAFEKKTGRCGGAFAEAK